MKKIISVILLLCMVLGLMACNQEPEITYIPPETTEAPTTEPTTEPITEPTQPATAYRHPLTGEMLTEPWTGRPVAVSLGNTKAAMPQYGVSQAALLYEAEVEGASTRVMAVFGDVKDVPAIGPVRSARTFFNSISQSLDAVLFHAGGSVRGRNGYHDMDGEKIPNWEHVNALAGSGSAAFYRDKNRQSAGYNLEHTMFTDGSKMQAMMEKKEYVKTNEGGTVTGMNFADDFPLTGEAANTVTVKFKGGKTSTFTYDAQTGLYSASQYKKDWIDGHTNAAMQFKNVLVLKADQRTKSDKEYPRSYYDLMGEGTGYLVIDGQMVEIKWSREDLKKPFVYTLTDGTPVCFEAGHTYVAISGAKEPVTCK